MRVQPNFSNLAIGTFVKNGKHERKGFRSMIARSCINFIKLIQHFTEVEATT